MNKIANQQRYGLSQLPIEVRTHIWKRATEIAHWISPINKGENGAVMQMEWLTFAYTIDGWIKCRQVNGETLPDNLVKMLMEFKKNDI